MGLDLLDVAHVAFLDLLGRLGDEARVGPDLVEELLHRGLLGGGLEADLLAQRRHLVFEPRDLLKADLLNLLGREVGRRVHPNAVEVEIASAGHASESHLLGRRREVVLAEFGDQTTELRVDSGFDRLTDQGQEAIGPITDPVGGRHEQLFDATPVPLEHADHVGDLGLGQVDAALLLASDLVGELPDAAAVLAEQVDIVRPLLVGSERSGAEHLVEHVQDEPPGGIGSDVEVRPVVLRRLDQETEVPPQQLQRDPVLVLDRLFVDFGQAVEQALGEGRVRLGCLERPVRETVHPLTTAESEVGVAVGDELQVLVASGCDALGAGGTVAGDLDAAGGQQWNDEDSEEKGCVSHDRLLARQNGRRCAARPFSEAGEGAGAPSLRRASS